MSGEKRKKRHPKIRTTFLFFVRKKRGIRVNNKMPANRNLKKKEEITHDKLQKNYIFLIISEFP